MPVVIPPPASHGPKSPFTPSFGVNPPAIEGRQQYVNDFAYALDQGAGAAGRTTLVTGQRGVGKSVMLNVYHQVAASRQWISVHEDASAGFAHRLTVTRLPEVFERLDDASARKQRITGGSLSVLGFGGSLQTDQENTNPLEPDFRHQLMRTLEVLQARGTGLLITLDEVHRSNLAELQGITDGISYAVRAHAPVAFVGAGLPETINSLVNSDVSTYLRRATRVELGNLTGDETRSALKLPAEEAGKTFTADALDQAVAASGNYPYLVQLIGDQAWRASAQNTHITVDDVTTAVGIARQRMYLQIHEPVITSLRPSERDYLRAMGQDDAGSRTSDIAERLGISAQNAGGIRERLISQGIIESTGWGTVAFTIPYTADYFTQPPARS